MDQRLFNIGSRIVPGSWSSPPADEVLQMALSDQLLQVSVVWCAAGGEVAPFFVIGAVCLGVRMSFPKLVRWLPKEGLLSDVPEEDVDRFFENRGLRHVVLRLCGFAGAGFHNVDLPPAMLGGSRLGFLGGGGGGGGGNGRSFGQQILQLTELVYHLHEVVHRLQRMEHELSEDGTLRFKPQLEGGCGYLLVAVVDLIEQLLVAVSVLPESLLRTLP